MQGEIYNVDYNDYVKLLGTAHFTRRSLYEAYQAVQQLQPSDLAIELDLQRFRILNSACVTCPRRGTCTSKCEFIGATEALGNVDANIWLIDMSEQEIGQRIRQLTSPTWTWISRVNVPFFDEDDGAMQLWEEGFKDRVLNSYQRRLEVLRRRAPAVWRVLIDERNTIMAARLAWIASQNLREDKKPSILALVGAAHVEGIRDLLRNPVAVKGNLQMLSLTFTPPALVRRISVSGD